MKKKLVSLMLVAAMTASLTACGSKKTSDSFFSSMYCYYKLYAVSTDGL